MGAIVSACGPDYDYFMHRETITPEQCCGAYVKHWQNILGSTRECVLVEKWSGLLSVMARHKFPNKRY